MTRKTIDLSGMWRFQPDPWDDGERRGFMQPATDHRRWPQVLVPGSFDSQNENMMFYEGKAWYRTTFPTRACWRGQRVVLTFHGANYRTKVWLNGTLLGENHDPFLPFSFPIDQHLAAKGANVLAVRVDNWSYPEDLPGKYVGWRIFGGILREVTITATSRSYVESAHVTAEPDGHFKLAYALCNEGRDRISGALVVTLSDAGSRKPGHEIGGREISMEAGARAEGVVEATVPGVKAWTPETPKLYVARVEWRTRSTVLDSVDIRSGFRKIETRGADLLLNGKKIFLMGFNRHEDSPRTDAAFDADIMRRDLEMMKDAGCNFIRLCHYPHHEAEMDLCDELGLLAKCEIPMWGDYWGDEVFRKNHAARSEAAERQLRKMIARDRNHPSVIIWSVSNETCEQEPAVTETNRRLVRLAKELDPSRLATHVSNRWQGPDSRWFEEDIICCNGYPAVWGPAAQNHPFEEKLKISAKAWREEWLPYIHNAHPDRPILVTEFGYAAFAETHDNRYSERWYAEFMKADFPAIAEKDYVCGATVWCWADHAWPPNNGYGFGNDPLSPFGVLTRGRKPKAPFAVLRKMFRNRKAQ